MSLFAQPSTALSGAPAVANRCRTFRASPSHAGRALSALAALLLAAAFANPSPARADSVAPQAKPRAATVAPSAARKSALDHSGRKRVGVASYYARRFSGRKMADGTPMRPESDNAASRTLPLGTTALVTNLKNGRSAMVTIRDRGPYAKGRIIDLSPRTARQLGLIDVGVAQVEVTPMTVPQPNGSVKSVVAMSDSDEVDLQRLPF